MFTFPNQNRPNYWIRFCFLQRPLQRLTVFRYKHFSGCFDSCCQCCCFSRCCFIFCCCDGLYVIDVATILSTPISTPLIVGGDTFFGQWASHLKCTKLQFLLISRGVSVHIHECILYLSITKSRHISYPLFQHIGSWLKLRTASTG